MPWKETADPALRFINVSAGHSTAAAIVEPRARAPLPCELSKLTAREEEEEGNPVEQEMEMRRRGGLGVLCLLCAGVMASVLPERAGARADDAKWHASSPGGRHNDGAPAPHHADWGLPPLSAPRPTAGGDLPPTQPAPHFGFPLQPTLGSAAAPPTAAAGEGYPFIGSNPTVPLPTGMTDTATVLPLPDTGGATGDKVVGLAAASVRVHVSMIGLGVIFAIVFLSATC